MTWTDAQKSFAETLPGYEDRPEQTRLAETVEKSLANGKHLAAQAGTGTGKSLAAMVPAIDRARETGMPVILATATKALQTQYGKDVAFLSENLGVEFTAVTVKGRGNYVCAAKLNENMGSIPAQLLTEITAEDFSGDVQDITIELSVKDRMAITSTSDECVGKSDCPFGNVCHAERVKAEAKKADVVLVNHALLAMDTVIRDAQRRSNPNEEPKSLLPTYEFVIVDEAHELREYVAGALSNEFSERGLSHFAAEVNNFLGGKPACVQAVNGAAKRAFTALTRALGRKKTIVLSDAILLAVEQSGLLDALKAMHAEIVAKKIHGDDKATTKRARLMKRSNSTIDRLKSILLADASDLVRWIERDERKDDVRLKFAPLSVAPFLREALWAHVTGVLLSATLAVGKDYSFVTGNLGMEEYDTFDAGTPFDYPNQAALFVPDGMLEPTPANSSRWRVQAQDAMKKLVLAAGGRTLLLFTSTDAMNEAHQALASTFQNAGLQVLVQGGPLNNKQLAETFKADETSVLFGLKSFATGFDVPGDALRLTIMDKLPFASPEDVVYAARSEAINARYGNKWAFFDRLAIPAMALDLQQGFGRQIRSKADQGMVAILDSRLHSKGYGRKIASSLPPARRIKDLGEAEAYLAQLKYQRG